jgi:HSP20 family protein
MSTFLEKLKKKDVIPVTADDMKAAQVQTQNNPPQDASEVPEQLKVDIYQTPSAILIYAQIAGASIHDFGVTIDGEGDIVTIKGQRTRPNGEFFEHPGHEGKEHILDECSWGKFYRQIILPAEVDASKTEAKMREGVLMLLLPLKEGKDDGVRIQVVSV